MGGLGLFYRALAAGAMAVVAPVTAVTSAAIPVVVGLLLGEPATGLRLLGIGCALVAIALVSLAPPPREPTRVTGVMLGLVLRRRRRRSRCSSCSSAQAGRVAVGPVGLWPVVASQARALVVGGLVILLRRPGPGRRAARSAGWSWRVRST